MLRILRRRPTWTSPPTGCAAYDRGVRTPTPRLLRAAALAALAALLAGGVSGCSVGPAPHGASTTAARSATPSSTPTPTASPTTDPLAAMTLQQKVGQLFMVGTQATEVDQTTASDISTLHAGSLFLAGRSYAGTTATAAIVAKFQALATQDATAGLPLFVATDQEGGEVQVLNGPGFDDMPSALQQGGMSAEALMGAAARWGSQLRASGVDMNLAPVADLVPSAQAAENNPPIGGFDRQFGYDPATITSHAFAFRVGMDTAGVVPVVKHFPGLGFVSENTDTDTGVTDTVTTSTSPSVGVFASQIDTGAQVVMMSSAIYSRIDAHSPAVFSSAVVTGLLRDKLGFQGVIMSDDLSAAAQTMPWSPADRAVLAIEAGVDIVLASADPSVAVPMIDAVVAKAQADPAFAATVDAAARRVVTLKKQLLG